MQKVRRHGLTAAGRSVGPGLADPTGGGELPRICGRTQGVKIGRGGEKVLLGNIEQCGPRLPVYTTSPPIKYGRSAGNRQERQKERIKEGKRSRC